MRRQGGWLVLIGSTLLAAGSATAKQREATEWSTSYWYNANENRLPRILLIGDSICNGYQSMVKDKLAGVAYTSAKAGVEGLMRQLAYDYGQYGIRVNAVAPTVTITGDRMKNLWGNKAEEEQERIMKAIPLRRLSEPREIAAAVVFLASDEASYITGITLDVVGGRYLR